MALRFLNNGYFAGKVGIGTDDPLYQLQVQDRIHIEDTTTLQPKISFSENTNTTGEFVLEYNGAGGGAGNYVTFYSEVSGWVGKGNGLNYIPQNGRVGIGTASPSAKLEVSDDNTIKTAIHIDNTSTGGHRWDIASIGSGVPGRVGNLQIRNDSDTLNIVEITGGGNVGIGTTTPGTINGVAFSSVGLHVKAGTLGRTITEGSNWAEYILNDSGASANERAKFIEANDGTLSLGSYDDNGTQRTQVSILNGGNVGIGNTAPGTKLHVGSGSGATVDAGYQMVIDSAGIAGLQILSATTQSGRIVFGDSGDNDIGMIKYDHTDNSMGFRTNGSGNERMRIDSSGNVGIGTTSPSRQLDVEGVIRFSSNSNQAVNGYGEIYTSYSYGKGQIFIAPEAVTSPTNFHPNGGVTIGPANTSPPANGLIVSGNVGIGTTTPQQKLDVVGRVRASYDTSNYYEIGASSAGGFVVGKSSGVETVNIRTYGNSHFTGGNVGIGTTSPGAKLDVVGGSLNVSDTYGTVKIIGTGGLSRVFLGDTADEDVGYLEYNHISNYFRIGVNATEKMRITSSGILMVGGTTGGYAGTKIHVGNFTDTQNGINILTSTTGYGYVLFGDGTGADTYRGQITYYHGDDSMSFNTNGSEKLRIVSGGGISFAGATNFGSAGQVLKSNGSASPAWVDASTVIGGPYLPLTGGTMTGNTSHSDNVKDRYGTGNDFQIWHDGSNTFLSNEGEGHLNIINTGDDRDIVFKTDDGTGATTSYMVVDGSAEQTRFYKDTRHADGIIANFGNSDDLKIYHDGSNSYIEDTGTGDIFIKASNDVFIQGANSEFMAEFSENGSVDLYHNGSKKFETTSTGIAVTGDINIDSALLSNQENTDIDTGVEVVAQVAHATYTAAFFDFVVKKGTNARSGTVYACHNGDTTPLVEFTETSTNDLGDTSDVTLSVDISGTNMRLLATVTSDDWSVKSLIRAI